MRILAIESSCDDTSVALLDCTEKGTTVINQKTASQIPVHRKYGGVVPEVAGRAHAENIFPVVEAVIDDYEKPEAIAVTSGPGLITGLLVGAEVAKGLSYAWDVPLIPVNHIGGHVFSSLLSETGETNSETFDFPALALIVSGGHTSLILMSEEGSYKQLGSTRDDAAGEAFDKVAKLLGLPYPGGPEISRLAQSGNPEAIAFTRPMLNDDNFDFSFAGLKTAVLYHLRDNPDDKKEDVAASFQEAVVDVLVQKTIRAAKKYKVQTLLLGGGVSNNTELRDRLESAAKELGIRFLKPRREYTMDNAAMIGRAGYAAYLRGDSVDWRELVVDPNWKITT